MLIKNYKANALAILGDFQIFGSNLGFKSVVIKMPVFLFNLNLCEHAVSSGVCRCNSQTLLAGQVLKLQSENKGV